MDSRILTERIKAYALSLGFDVVGVTTAEPLEQDGAWLQSWLDDGYAGEMAYMVRNPEQRFHPQSLMPEAKSILCLALNYYQKTENNGRGTNGRVARYAFGEDYHRIIEEKLAHLVVCIEGLGGRCARGRGDVDHGPMLERALARRAGMGFIGKNTNLITQNFGSWVFLAEVITDLELVPDPPVSKQTEGCGSCRLCIDACPTAALTDLYRLDARRCISYLTIEQKGSIPIEIRNLVGEWAFGCDICQEICPYNHRPVETGEKRLRSDQGVGPALSVSDLDPHAFKQRLAHTPLSRAKRRGLGRNLAVALGNAGDKKDLPTLLSMMEDPEPLVQEHAAWGYREIAKGKGTEEA